MTLPHEAAACGCRWMLSLMHSHSVWMLSEMSMAGTLCVSAPIDTNWTPVSAITLRQSRGGRQGPERASACPQAWCPCT